MRNANKQPIACSVCGSLSEPTMNGVPQAGLVLEPLLYGGYDDFIDSLGIKFGILEQYEEEEYEAGVAEVQRFFDKNKRFLCHDCVVELFRWLKIEPDPHHHQFVVPGVRCCEWGYDLHKQ